jgi:hypothetical protein
MQIGIITLDGRQVGVVSWSQGDDVLDPFVPDLDGYVPEGRASERTVGAPVGASVPHYGGHVHHSSPVSQPEHHSSPVSHGGTAHVADRARHHTSREGYTPKRETHTESVAPKGETYTASGGQAVRPGSAEVDQAIVDAARAHHLDVNTMRAIADIESSSNPASNAHNSGTQYKGLYQIGRDEWRRFGAGGNIYSARDNAMGAARMFEANRNQFRQHFGRDPTDTELYMMHQQGLGFYTRRAMTNIGGNLPPSARSDPRNRTHEGFEAWWGRRLARGKASFAARHRDEAEAKPDKPFDPETMVP